MMNAQLHDERAQLRLQSAPILSISQDPDPSMHEAHADQICEILTQCSVHHAELSVYSCLPVRVRSHPTSLRTRYDNR